MECCSWVRALRTVALGLLLVACGSSGEGDEQRGVSHQAIGVGQPLVIRQIYERFSQSGTYSRMFVELYNKGTGPASLANLSVQAPANGETSGLFRVVALLPPVSLAPGQSFLLATQPFDNSPEFSISPDMTVTYTRSGSTSGWKVALVNSVTALPCGGSGGGGLCSSTYLAQIIDLVAMGTGAGAAPAEGTAAALPTDTTSLQRKVAADLSIQDTNNNSADFVSGTPSLRNMDSNQAPPISAAPPLGTAVAAPFGSLTNFIYAGGAGSDQTGVQANAIDANHAAWVTGYVKDGATGAGLCGVTVSVVGQSQYGQATSRGDGRYDLVVNGGATYNLRFSRTGSVCGSSTKYFPADRLVTTGWQRTESVDDVLLVAADSKPNPLTGNSASFQRASGTAVAADADSTARQAVLMVPPQTLFKVGNTPLGGMTLRLTEYTAGANGLKRMPAPLTGSPGYTYAVELSADGYEGQSIDFRDASNNPKDVFFYVEDIIPSGFPVGAPVPTGYYDRAKGSWIASKSGTVINVSVSPTHVVLVDVSGKGFDNSAAATFGINSAELSAIDAQYFVAGQTVTKKLWRVPINHMTPYDCNWPILPPDCDGAGATAVCPGPPPAPPPPPPPNCGGCCAGPPAPGSANGDGGKIGSIIRCDSQSLGEVNSVAGTNFKLLYNSQRTPGFLPNRQIKLDLTGAQGTIHTQEKLIAVDISIAGQTHHREFTPTPNLSWTFQWDGLDGAGRAVVGSAIATVKLRSYFTSKYVLVDQFGKLPDGALGNITSSRAFVSFERRMEVPLFGLAPAGSWSLGDWTLNQHHFLDVPARTLFLGSGERKPVSADSLNGVLLWFGSNTAASAFAADGESATKAETGFYSSSQGRVAVGPNGDVFVADIKASGGAITGGVIRRIDSAGNIKTIIGSGKDPCYTGSNQWNPNTTDATLLNMDWVEGFVVGPDGSIYIAVGRKHQIVLKATPIAGTGNYSITGLTAGSDPCVGSASTHSDNAPASQARFSTIKSIALGADGSIYVADPGDLRTYRIDPAGVITHIAGNGTGGTAGDRTNEGKFAKTVPVHSDAVAAGPDGAVYIFDTSYDLVRVDRTGKLHYLNAATLDSTTQTKTIDGVALSSQTVYSIFPAMTSTLDGSLLFVHLGNRTDSLDQSKPFIRVADVRGIVNTLTATATRTTTPVLPGLATFNGPPNVKALASSPNGDIYAVSDQSVYRIPSLKTQTLPSAKCNDLQAVYLIPSGDSGFCFDASGKHLKTIDLHTGAALYAFNYDPATSVLKSVTGPDTRTLNVVKTATAYELTPETETLQKTTITVPSATGHATKISDTIGDLVPNPRPDGLLQGLTDGELNHFTFGYDVDGRLTSDASPIGTQTLTRSVVNGARRVTHKTPMGNTSGGRQTWYDFIQDAAGLMTHTTTFPNGSTETRVSDPQGTEKRTAADGTVTTSISAAASQLGGVAAIEGTTTIALPSTVNPVKQTITRTLSDPIGGPRVSTEIYDDTLVANVKDTATTTTTYDANGQTIVYDSPEGRHTTTKLNARGQITQMQIGSATAGSGLTPTNYAYTSGLLSSVTQGGRSTSFTYAASGLADAGYLFHVTDAGGVVTEQSHDIRGRLLSSEAAFGTAIASKPTFTWFKHDVLNTVTTPELLKVHTFGYDAVKEIQQYLPPALTGVANPATTYEYNADRDLTKEIPAGLANPNVITRTYIAATGQLDTVLLPATPVDAGIPSLAGTLDYDYHGANNSTGAAWGQISQITGPTPMNNVQYKYNGFLRTGITWAGDVSGSVAWTYNTRLWPNKETLTTTSSFDRFLGYDKDGLLLCNSPTSCAPVTTNPLTFGADALTLSHSPIHGKVTSVVAGGVSETWKYSDLDTDYAGSAAYGELREQVATLGGTTVADLVYDAPGGGVSERRDAMGRIRFKTETFRDATSHANVTNKWEYTYDARGQLKIVKLNGTTVFDGTYDKNGNVKTAINNGTPVNCTADEQDRIKSCTVSATTVLSFSYYDNGEVKTKTNAAGTWKYYYDAQSRLRVVVTPGGTKIEYVVDGEGRRIAKKVNGALQRKWIYGSGLSPIAELDGSGALISRFIYGSRTNTPDLVIRGATIYRLISDQLGSPRYAVNVSDKDDVKYEAVYNAFGGPSVAGGLASTTLSWIPFGFAGGLYDTDTGLVHFGAREYDPEIGRWTSKDPIRFDGDNSNLYAYIANDPVNRSDASGLRSQPTISTPSDMDPEPEGCDGGPGRKDKLCPSAGYCGRNYEGCMRECVGRGCDCCERAFAACNSCQPFNFHNCLR